MKKLPIAIFAYAFRHQKTRDFINILVNSGYLNLYIIAAPKIELNKNVDLDNLEYETAYELASKFGLNYIETQHDNIDAIKSFLSNEVKTGIISGARIIKPEVIKLFENGIINFHPGAVPETSGLDSFYWMVKNKALPGVTVHYIDHRVDAGELIFFQNTPLTEITDMDLLKENIYKSQLQALHRLLSFFNFDKKCLTTKIIRPFKNPPMGQVEKESAIKNYHAWLKETHKKKVQISRCYHAVATDNIELLKLNFNKEYITFKNNNGRGLLSESAYYNSVRCLTYLLENKCNPNEVNDKGTTPLMYAKTKLLKKISSDGINCLNILKKYGAQVYTYDIYSKNIFSYLKGKNKKRIELELKK